MPRGIYNRAKAQAEEPVKQVKPEPRKETVTNAERKKEEEPKREVLTPPPTPQAPTKPKLEPLGPGQAYFEAPDGTVIIGEDSRNEIWYRAMNGGKGGWINRKR